MKISKDTFKTLFKMIPRLLIIPISLFSIIAFAQSVQMELDGEMKIHHEGPIVADPGTVRWSECDYELWNGTDWVSLTNGSKVSRYAKSEGGTLADLGKSVTSDLNGNIYMTGYITGNATFENEQVIGKGSQDIFMSKYDKNGNFQWVVSAGGSSADQGYCVKSDNQGNVYLTGLFQDTASFENTEIISTGEFDIFLAKYNDQGNLEWVVKAGGHSSDEGTSISCLNHDEIYLTGKFQDTAYFGLDSIISHGGSDIFLAKYNEHGNLLWLKNAGGDSFDNGSSISEDKNQNIFLTGHYRGTATFDSIVVHGSSSNNIFLAKYNSNGSPIWVKTAGGSGNDVGTSVTTDSNDDIYITGFFSSTASFETETLISEGGADLFIAKYSASGSIIWVRHGGGSDSESGAGIGADANGNVYITGYFRDSFEIENNQLISRGDRDIFLIKYSHSGSLIWLKHLGEEFNDFVSSLAIDPNNKIYITGLYQSETVIGLNHLQSNGFSDIFLAKFDP